MNIKDVSNSVLVKLVHQMEDAHLLVAETLDMAPKDVSWPAEYAAAVKEGELRGLFL